MATAICNDQNQFRIYLREKTRPTMALIFTFAYITSLIARTYGGAFNTRLAMDGMLLFPGLFLGLVSANGHDNSLVKPSAQSGRLF
ncbi:hypothetical protein RLO149_c028730 [Roseobacter litoralis Och 149]|uniref:Uncharacterized protein n=1 Tax=Roseobacter litoralis (strain ATCC 49566 / DSM 6996 / JCM 21268 / NBRC 15278 / OCh 149) TaxID=391595 RepID=F7ZGA1_ROSLO|nr:hypothetical protein RLO149_c028730 [Roseobacter litoralis Och 149]